MNPIENILFLKFLCTNYKKPIKKMVYSSKYIERIKNC